MPEVTWTNCAEQLPPDDLDIIINTWTGHKFKSVGWILKHEVNAFGLANFKWTPYTPEKRKEINACTVIAMGYLNIADKGNARATYHLHVLTA